MDGAPDPQATLFHLDPEYQSFDDLAVENGQRRWSGRQLMALLEYKGWKSFSGVINKAATACMKIGADTSEHFVKQGDDYMLTKFACYLVAMNGDSSKAAVALAQAYFATIAEAFQRYIECAEDVERVDVRQELTDQQKTLNSAAKTHGVTNFAFFQNAGYVGLYGMHLRDLKKRKGLPATSKRSPLDFMGKRELAANLFRITETEARIDSDDPRGQRQVEGVAKRVGKEVRKTMMRSGGRAPEDLPTATDIKRVESDLKRTMRGLAKGDEPRQITEG